MRDARESLEIASQILQRIMYATLATASVDGEPANAPVFSAFDGDINIFWTSAEDAVHSRNIRSNGRAYIVFYDSTVAEGTGLGLYMQCAARELREATEIQKARAHLEARKGGGSSVPADFLPPNPRRVYSAEPQSAWVNDEEQASGYVWDTRQQLDLRDLRTLMASHI